MNDYLVYTFTLSPMGDEAADMLVALLADIGFEGFQQTDRSLLAYLPRGIDAEDAVRGVVDAFPLPGVSVSCSEEPLAPQDWNARWEAEGFRPIEMGTRCLVCKPGQEAGLGPHDYTLFIEPRMAFGSGAHATTRAIVAQLLSIPLDTLRCLDMGCGTGILAICMALRGANQVVAIDIDPLCVGNTRHNLALNAVDGVEVRLGDATAIEGEFDVIVANIHRNIICHDMPVYARHLAPHGRLLLSGFFPEDLPVVRQTAEAEGLVCTHFQEEGEEGREEDTPKTAPHFSWVVASFERRADSPQKV